MRLRPTSAGRAVVVLALGLVIAALLDARGLHKQAVSLPGGTQRTLAVRASSTALAVSDALRLTAPRHALQVAIGRSGQDSIDPTVHLEPPPPAGPLGRRPPAKRPRRPRRQPVKPVFSAARPLHVLVLGDSLAQVPGEGLERVGGSAIDVVGIESRLSTGLARPDLYNWFDRFTRLLAGARPNVVVLSFGADDAHDYLAGVPRGRSVGRFGSASWRAEYRRRVAGVTRELTAAGIRTVWLALPITDGTGFRSRFRVVNTIIRSVVAQYVPRAGYVDTWRLLESAHGGYTAYLRVHGQLTLMRLPDGVHYTAAAGDRIAASIVSNLRTAYTLR